MNYLKTKPRPGSFVQVLGELTNPLVVQQLSMKALPTWLVQRLFHPWDRTSLIDWAGNRTGHDLQLDRSLWLCVIVATILTLQVIL